MPMDRKRPSVAEKPARWSSHEASPSFSSLVLFPHTPGGSTATYSEPTLVAIDDRKVLDYATLPKSKEYLLGGRQARVRVVGKEHVVRDGASDHSAVHADKERTRQSMHADDSGVYKDTCHQAKP
ncbi:hypothetical protein FB45DRAFT_997474 [Roridomyces roridus]|uniref:Uncharacterized protein n=1 Tax=Roridomyces roridus TaxID=1738132 RepID=A0AAD7CJS5_9AGAR|nr:hypothetical protein FB45DRAFT_997474 [Roridomyces roridus]